MSRPFRCSERPTAMKPTARTTIAMIAQITTCAVSHIRRLRGVATDALLGWSLPPGRSARQQEKRADGRHRSAGSEPPLEDDRELRTDVHGCADLHPWSQPGDVGVVHPHAAVRGIARDELRRAKGAVDADDSAAGPFGQLF